MFMYVLCLILGSPEKLTSFHSEYQCFTVAFLSGDGDPKVFPTKTPLGSFGGVSIGVCLRPGNVVDTRWTQRRCPSGHVH